MSIMPGIDTAAPLRTLSSRGFLLSPNFLPVAFSVFLRFFSTSSISPSGSRPPRSLYSLQVAVVMVKPGGTGRPLTVMSARLAPLPPSSILSPRPPSALPSPKKNTRLPAALRALSTTLDTTISALFTIFLTVFFAGAAGVRGMSCFVFG